MAHKTAMAHAQAVGDEVSELKQQIATQAAEIASLEQHLSLALERIQDLVHWRFGPRTERIDDPGQQVLTELLAELQAGGAGQAAAALIDADALAAGSGAQGRKQGKRRLPSEMCPDLRIEVEIIDLPEEERFDADGNPLVRMGTEIKEEIVYDPATAYIRRVIRVQYGLATTGEKVAIAPPPPCIVTKGMLANATILQIIILHTVDCLPFNRIAEQVRRAGANIGRQLVTSSFHAFCPLAKPLMAAIEADLMEAQVLHVDGSFVFRQDRKRRRRCTRSPVYAITDGRQVLMKWRPDEKHETAADLIPGYTGYLVRDEWDGWLKLDAGQLTHVGCNAHARRWFAKNQEDPDAAKMVALYAQLYAIEHRAAESGLVSDALIAHRLRLRREHSAAIMDAIEAHAHDMIARRSSGALAAANYIINHRVELRRFLDNGALPPDNNLAERVLRRNAMLRAARRFFVAEDGGENLAIAMSITGSCRLLDLNPLAYMQAVLPALFEYREAKRHNLPLPDLRPFTPWAYAQSVAKPGDGPG